MVFDKTVLVHGAGMVEHDRVVFPGAGRSTRPTICLYSPIFLVGLARMQQLTSGKSQPSVNTMQLVITFVSPEARRAKAASRSSLGVVPSMCSAFTPDLMNSSRM